MPTGTDSLQHSISLKLYFYNDNHTHTPPVSEGSFGFGVVTALVGIVFVVAAMRDWIFQWYEELRPLADDMDLDEVPGLGLLMGCDIEMRMNYSRTSSVISFGIFK